MTGMEWITLSVATLIFMFGLVGSLLPVVPGSFIVWLGVIVHRLWMGADASVTWKIVILTGILTLFGQIVDFLMGIWGARKFGASWKGAVGAFVGAFVGFLVPPPLFWLIVGPIAGAVVGELAAGRTFREGGKAGVGTVVGGIIAFALKFGISMCVIALFFFDLFLF
ncbi:MAG: DUF456 domain-containing protein [Puniceicoccaceae bacterium]|nr:DUF456 domain-containing protein [Puniceicoccaceae bacterium]